MSEKINQELERILYNIEVQIHDLLLEQKGHTIKLYFDTSDVVDSITGISRFYNKAKFQEHNFFSNKTLLHSLATDGALGEIYLLSPHKAELFRQLKHLKDIQQTKRSVYAFLKDTKLDRFTWDKVFNENNEPNQEVIKDITDSIIENLKSKKVEDKEAESLYKTVQNLSPWYDRLKEIISEQRLIINSNNNENEKVEYGSIVSEDYFQELKKIFNHYRREDKKSINNITDAFCLSLLIQKNQNFLDNQDGEKMELPRFFASTGILKLFLNVENNESDKEIKDYIDNIRQLLAYHQTSKGRLMGVIKDERYFILRAILNSDKHETKELRIKNSLHTLYQWKKQIESFIEVDSIEADTQLVRQNWIDEFNKRREIFYSELWLKSKAPRQLIDAAKYLVKAFDEIKHSDELERKIETLLSDTERKIKNEVEDARMLVLFDNILSEKEPSSKKRFESLRGYFAPYDAGFEQKFSNYFPFERYSFPKSDITEIAESVKDLLEGNETVKRGLLTNYAQLIAGDWEPSEVWIKILTKVALLLKTIEANDVLIHLLERIDPQLPNFSFKILFAEQLIKFKEKFSRAEKILEELIALYDKEKHSKQNKKLRNDLAIGLSLIHYWRWEKGGGISLWLNNRNTEDDLKKQKELHKLIKEAIKYAKEAYDIWTASDVTEKEEIYALNLLFYFQTRSNMSPYFDNSEIYASDLSDHSNNNPQKWSFRYDDSLGLHYAKMASYAEDESKFKHYIDLAQENHVNELEIAKIDETVSTNEKRIKQVKRNDFRKDKNLHNYFNESS